MLANTGLTAAQRRHVHFTLGKVYDDHQKWEQAFAHYQQGNALIDAGFDMDRFASTVEATIEICTRTFLRQGQTLGSQSELPVLIVGMMRSGTSLVEQILASHPQVMGGGELLDIGRLANSLASRMRANVEYPMCLPGLDPMTASSMADDYLAKLRSLSADAARVTDKMPGNFMHLGLVALLLPAARVILCRRDPLDLCLSCYFQNFTFQKTGLSYTTDLRSLGLFYRQHEKLNEHWRKVLQLAMMEVKYEELVAAPERVSRELIDFCVLPWDPACLEFHKTQRVVQTASHWQVRQPIYAKSVDRWKHYEPHLGELKRALDGR